MRSMQLGETETGIMVLIILEIGIMVLIIIVIGIMVLIIILIGIMVLIIIVIGIMVLIIIVIAPSLKTAAGRAGGRDGIYPGWLESSLMAAVADGITISDGSRRH